MNYTDADVINNAKKVYSMAGLLRSLDLVPAGGSYANMKRKLQELKVDTTHWTGQGWNLGQQTKDYANYTKAGSLKKHLINNNGHKCESCKLEVWLENKIPLELHHIDGNKTNNLENNLQLLCPNCHALTDNYRGKSMLFMSRHYRTDDPI